MIKYKILTFQYNKGTQALYIPRDIDEKLEKYTPHGAFHNAFTISSFLNDEKGSIKDGTFSIHTIYLYKENEPTTGVILSIGDEISNTRLITIRKFIYNFLTNSVDIDVNDCKNTKEEDIVSLSSLAGFTKVRDKLRDRIELFKVSDTPKISTNTNDNLFDLQEIEEVLDTFLDKPEVQSALVEFKEYKTKKNSNVLESEIKSEESKYVLPEKFYFKLDTDEKVKWMNQYKQNTFHFTRSSFDSSRRAAYPSYDRDIDTLFHLFNIDNIPLRIIDHYIDVDDKFHEVLKKYPLKDYADLQTKDKSSTLPF